MLLRGAELYINESKLILTRQTLGVKRTKRSCRNAGIDMELKHTRQEICEVWITQT